MARPLEPRQTADGRQTGNAALDRLQASLDAAETALKDPRTEVGRHSRELLADLGKTLRDARRNLTRSRRRILKDLEQIPQALIRGKSTRAPARRASAPTRSGSARRSRSARTAASQSRAASRTRAPRP